MRNAITIKLFLCLLSLTSCQQGSKSLDELSRIWVESKYLDCMSRFLPCQCLGSKPTTSPVILLPNLDEIIFVQHNSESEYYKLNSPVEDSLFAYREEQKLFEVRLTSTNLALVTDNAKAEYIPVKFLDSVSVGLHPLGTVNMLLFKSSWFNPEVRLPEELQDLEQMKLYCNYELEKVNLVSTIGSCENKYLLEVLDGKLLIYDYLNSCDPKRYPVEIQRELKLTFEKK